MPWTLSHPAAVLPLRRFTPRPFDLAALTIGSMTPDLGYYIARFDLATFAHTLAGSFLACLPAGVVMLLVFYLFARPVCHTLPSPHREMLLSRCPTPPHRPGRWMSVLFSLLLGAWTHNFWDAFTHKEGWFVARLPFLQREIFAIGSAGVPIFLILQEVSTVFGFVILLAAYRSWLRQHRPLPLSTAADESKRYLFWAILASVSLLVSLPAALFYAASNSLNGLFFVRSVAFRTAMYLPLVALPLLLLGAAWFYFQRPERP
ncbi:DUF4184 family protein [soil metagenome]